MFKRIEFDQARGADVPQRYRERGSHQDKPVHTTRVSRNLSVCHVPNVPYREERQRERKKARG